MAESFHWEPNDHAEGELVKITEEFMDTLGDGLLARAQRLVPKASWSLNDSLEKNLSTDNGVVTVEVGVSLDFVGKNGELPYTYGALVEEGTSKMDAQPYLMPALLQTNGVNLLEGGGS